MLYHIGDLFLLNNTEVTVSFINSDGKAYVTPVDDEETDSQCRKLKGLVIGVLDNHGIDRHTKSKVIAVNNSDCGAV